MLTISRIDNHYHSEIKPSITCDSSEWWFVRGKLHRGGGKPAVISGGTRLYYWRGINITKNIAQCKLAPSEILQISNMERRQAAMEILGYEKFLNTARLIDKWSPPRYDKIYPISSNPMYSLYVLDTKNDEQGEDIKILMMCDPSKKPVVKYFIRVNPQETKCSKAVAHSYKYDTWEEFDKDREWV